MTHQESALYTELCAIGERLRVVLVAHNMADGARQHMSDALQSLFAAQRALEAARKPVQE